MRFHSEILISARVVTLDFEKSKKKRQNFLRSAGARVVAEGHERRRGALFHGDIRTVLHCFMCMGIFIGSLEPA